MVLDSHAVNWAVIGVDVLLAAAAAGHALLHKRDPRSALGWIAVCVFFPIAGSVLYYLFGINRIQTRARKLARRLRSSPTSGHEPAAPARRPRFDATADLPAEYSELARIATALSANALLGGNRIEPLYNGEQAFPAMLATISNAVSTLYLSTYILDTDDTGRQFIATLGAAARRGVDVRVLIDGIGEWYSWPHAARLLRKQGVRTARFLPPKLLPPTLRINLRNHRKILVADGTIGYAGGMNIGSRHLTERVENPARNSDVHFRLEGPIVTQLERAFLDDWLFATGEASGTLTEPTVVAGQAIGRVLVAGPDEDLDTIATVLVSAVSAARRRVAIMTPYFLPPAELIGALQAAALRGVDVTVILPGMNNLRYVHWATRNMLWELLQRGVRVLYQPPPFAHSKLFVVDGHYSVVGSANIDARSLRLNFELVVEIYDRPFAERLLAHFDAVGATSQEVFPDDLNTRPLYQRIRDALAWLFSPYL